MKHLINYEKYSINEKVSLDKIEKIVDTMGVVKNTSLPNKIKALLDTLAFAEGTYDSDNGYKTLFGGSKFSSYNDHPRTIIKKGSLKSSAAGRYQFLSKTWDYIMKGKKFTPENQDNGAVKLIKSKGAYNYILKGDFENGIKKLAKTWASLPYSPYGQGSWYAYGDKDKMKILKDVFSKRLSKYNGNKKINKDNKTTSNELKKGDINNNVKNLQKSLVKLGYDLPKFGIDGKFGNETLSAVKKVSKKELNKNISSNSIDKEIYNDIIDLSNQKIA